MRLHFDHDCSGRPSWRCCWSLPRSRCRSACCVCALVCLSVCCRRSGSSYLPCRLLLNREASEIHLHHVVEGVSLLTTASAMLHRRAEADGGRHGGPVDEVRVAVCARRDPRQRAAPRGWTHSFSVCCDLHCGGARDRLRYAGLEDFELVFASEYTRSIFHEYVQHLKSTAAHYDSAHAGDAADTKPVKYEFELDSYEQRVVLGRGSFGCVFSALDVDTKKLVHCSSPSRSTDALQIAVKEIEFRDASSIFALQEEINMHKRWKHPHIVQYLGSEVEGSVIRIFLEQVPGACGSAALSAISPAPCRRESVGPAATQVGPAGRPSRHHGRLHAPDPQGPHCSCHLPPHRTHRGSPTCTSRTSSTATSRAATSWSTCTTAGSS